jgi:hypothetical protein
MLHCKPIQFLCFQHPGKNYSTGRKGQRKGRRNEGRQGEELTYMSAFKANLITQAINASEDQGSPFSWLSSRLIINSIVVSRARFFENNSGADRYFIHGAIPGDIEYSSLLSWYWGKRMDVRRAAKGSKRWVDTRW